MKNNYINRDDKIFDKETFFGICDFLRDIVFKLFSGVFHKIKETNNETINESFNKI